jgi:hypothetical protein
LGFLEDFLVGLELFGLPVILYWPNSLTGSNCGKTELISKQLELDIYGSGQEFS